MRRTEVIVLDRSESYRFLRDRLVPRDNPGAQQKFDFLNRHLAFGYVNAGEVIVIGDPDTATCSREEIELKHESEQVHDTLRDLSSDETAFALDYYDVLDEITGMGSTLIGASSSAWQRHFSDVHGTLKEIETLYKSTQMANNGKLLGEDFFAERRALEKKLNRQLAGIGRYGTGLKDHPRIKHRLGISSRSLAHHWSGDFRGIPGYREKMQRVGKATKLMSRGGYLGIALDAGNSAVAIHKACTVGREHECRQVAFEQTGRFVGSSVGAYISGAAAGAICVGFTIATGGAGALVCGLIVGGALGYAGGTIGGAVGSAGGRGLGQWLYGGN